MERKSAIEKVILSHPSVGGAAVFRGADQMLTAFVLIDDMCSNGAVSREAAEAAVIERWRKTYDLTQFTKEAIEARTGFNTAGWNSSYTRKPIPMEDMQEWVQTTVSDILRLHPKKLYEIGCGTGLLLTKIAPHCQQYIGADISKVVLASLNEHLTRFPDICDRVETLHRQADDFTGMDERSLDTVVLSSVIQYFPSLSYLTRVLDCAIRVVKPGGHVYVGDVRSLPLFPAFTSTIELFQATDQTTLSELHRRVQRRVAREAELIVSPAYFLNLKRQFQDISTVDIRPLHGHAKNEMSGYRFQAILRVGSDQPSLVPVDFLDWDDRRWTLDEIRFALRQRPNAGFGLTRIRNSRIERDIEIARRMQALHEGCTVGELRRELGQRSEEGLNPQSLFDLEADGLDFSVHVSWAACRRDGSYDAAFIPKATSREDASIRIDWPQPDNSDCVRFSNSPGQDKSRAEQVDVVEKHCHQYLPGESIPEVFYLVDSLPLTVTGEVDIAALIGWTRTLQSER